MREQRKRWTDDDTKLLKDNYAIHGAQWVAEQLNRTLLAVCSKASHLGIHKRKYANLIGNVYGRWIVIGDSTKRSGGNTYWLCRCACGNKAEVQRPALINGTSTQCAECAWKIRYQGDIPYSYFRGVEARAKRNNVEFNISIEEIDSLYKETNARCAISNLAIGFHDSGDQTKSPSLRSHTASLDRIDNSLGYAHGNIQWLHKDVNWMKNAYDQQYFIYLCRTIAEYTEGTLAKEKKHTHP